MARNSHCEPRVFFSQHLTSRLKMRNARLRMMTGLAGAALCVFAVTSYAQDPNNPPAGTDPAAQTAAPTTTAQPATPTGDASVPAPADQATTNSTVTRSTATDIATTDNTTTSFPGGVWGITAVAVLVLLALFGLFRGRDRTVVRDTYTTNTVNPPVVTTRTTGMGTATGDRTLNTRVASST
jgi:hypothetical protein